MHWLSSNAYIAAWLSPLIALIGLIIQNNRQNTDHQVDWSRIIFYVSFLTFIAVEITRASIRKRSTALASSSPWDLFGSSST